MPYSMKFYQDQLVEGGKAGTPLPPAQRLLFVRHGCVNVNGDRLAADESVYTDGPLDLHGDAPWSQVWRWEIGQPNTAPVLFSGTGILSNPRLERVITTLGLAAGEHWLFRLDSITSAPGRVTPRHQHHGPGIRCLYQGTFNVEDTSHAVKDIVPGQPWWESGTDTVVAWHSTQMPAIFIRALLLPTELAGKMSNIWLTDGPAPKAAWRLFQDQVITLS